MNAETAKLRKTLIFVLSCGALILIGSLYLGVLDHAPFLGLCYGNILFGLFYLVAARKVNYDWPQNLDVVLRLFAAAIVFASISVFFMEMTAQAAVAWVLIPFVLNLFLMIPLILRLAFLPKPVYPLLSHSPDSGEAELFPIKFSRHSAVPLLCAGILACSFFAVRFYLRPVDYSFSGVTVHLDSSWADMGQEEGLFFSSIDGTQIFGIATVVPLDNASPEAYLLQFQSEAAARYGQLFSENDSALWTARDGTACVTGTFAFYANLAQIGCLDMVIAPEKDLVVTLMNVYPIGTPLDEVLQKSYAHRENLLFYTKD